MVDTEKIIFQGMADAASALAETAGEGFVLAITAAYLAGKEAGQMVALKPVPPAA